jgi:site-specific DNA-methyltransferase (adenine-specific)
MELDKIYNIDCYEFVKTIPDKSIDLIVTDPPYEIVAGGSGGCFGVKHRDYHHEYKTLAVDEHKREGLKIASNTENLNCVCAGFDYKLLDELDRVMKKINIYIWCNKTQVSSLMEHYEDKDCNVDLLVRVKTNPIPTCNNKYLSDLEYCVFARDKNTPLYGSYETKSKVFISPANKEDKDLYKHPTIKPLKRIEDFVINSSKVGDIIFDPFMGSGTTAVACKELKRHYVGCEIDPKFYQIAVDRLNEITQEDKNAGVEQLKLF